ncbi:MAG TPA: dolichyl-phosphate beta-glucosyltransferase [Bryobacterales bacterium]|nr:dolichyl-phosphate beta-glucosyltransferase [Bryobacterales bacterium]
MLPSLSVVIPAYNEESRLPASLEKVAQYLTKNVQPPSEILVVNDGSSDGTFEIARLSAAALTTEGLRVTVLDNGRNRGKGYSVRHGVTQSRYGWVLITDADLSAPIEECAQLFAAVERQGCDVAIGSRAIDRSLIGVHQSSFREMMGRAFNVAVRIGAGLPFKDTQCGFKLFSDSAARDVFSRQLLEGFGFDVEVLYLARRLGYQVAEVPVRWNHCEGTKVRMFSGADAFLDILRVRKNDWTGKYSK